MHRDRSSMPYAVLGGAVLLALLALLLYVPRFGGHREPEPPASQAASQPPATDPLPEVTVEPEPPEDPAAVLATTGAVPGDADPQALVERIGRALEAGDLDTVDRLVGEGVLSPAQVERLAELAGQSRLKMRGPQPVREVGEIELNKLSRWALELEGESSPRIFFDLRRRDGRWVVERVTLPEDGEGPPRALLADSLGITDLFVQAVLRLDFELAREFVDSSTVSDAKIAGLCILFEEGGYRLRPRKPLRRLFERGDTAGFLANVEATDGSQAAQFGLTTKRPEPRQQWRVTEVNLDSLLEDYARRVADGDVYYTPLVANPEGGDTLVLYFGFDEDSLTPRTQRQLEIVARILRGDTGKKITISGHTDSLGSDDYNEQLSARRAAIVGRFLVDAGVSADQVVTVARGKTQPRRPNLRDDGSDDPLGRRANRRTEIYLDF